MPQKTIKIPSPRTKTKKMLTVMLRQNLKRPKVRGKARNLRKNRNPKRRKLTSLRVKAKPNDHILHILPKTN